MTITSQLPSARGSPGLYERKEDHKPMKYSELLPEKSVGRISRRDRSLESEALAIGSLRNPLASPSPRKKLADRVGPQIGSNLSTQRSVRSQEDLQTDDLRVRE